MCLFVGWQLPHVPPPSGCVGNPLPSYEKCLQCRFYHDAMCMLDWTGSTVQTVQVKGQPDARLRVQEGETGQSVGLRLWACLFYKQWEQISIGASLPLPYGEDVLCFRSSQQTIVFMVGDTQSLASYLLSTNNDMMSMLIHTCGPRMQSLHHFQSEHNGVLNDCVCKGSQGLSH